MRKDELTATMFTTAHQGYQAAYANYKSRMAHARTEYETALEEANRDLDKAQERYFRVIRQELSSVSSPSR